LIKNYQYKNLSKKRYSQNLPVVEIIRFTVFNKDPCPRYLLALFLSELGSISTAIEGTFKQLYTNDSKHKLEQHHD